MKVQVYDFFSGCGGTSCGFKQAGFDIAWASDIDKDAAETFKKNFPEAHFELTDICTLDPSALAPFIGDRKEPILFTGCAPCQPFSRQNRSGSVDDPRRNLLDEFSRFIRFWIPDFIFIENVPGMQSKSMHSKIFNNFLRLLKELNYSYDYQTVQASWFGVPQTRTRLVLLASRLGTIKIPAPTHGHDGMPTSKVRDWISDIPELEAGKTHESDNDHFALGLSELNLLRIKSTPEGGSRDSWPDELKLECHRNYKGHTDVYGRLSWDKLASGLTTKCISYSNGRFGHPDQNRALSLREAACLQTFPSIYSFYGSQTSRARQVGNAVPPILAKRMGRQIKDLITSLPCEDVKI